MGQNCLKHALTVEEHFVVSEAEHFLTLAGKISVSDIVAPALRVLEPVRLNDQLSANAKKVDDVRTDWNLPAKLDPVQATIAQETPKSQFNVRRRAAYRSGAQALAR